MTDTPTDLRTLRAENERLRRESASLDAERIAIIAAFDEQNAALDAERARAGRLEAAVRDLLSCLEAGGEGAAAGEDIAAAEAALRRALGGRR